MFYTKLSQTLKIILNLFEKILKISSTKKIVPNTNYFVSKLKFEHDINYFSL